MAPGADVLVVGAGVSGLTTAACLAEAGLAVRVLARDLPPDTTSCAAGAIWSPYLVSDERAPGWSAETLHMLEGLVGVDGAGVRWVHGQEAARGHIPAPAWATGLDRFRTCTRAELPDGFASGWWYSAPVVDMPAYLGYLLGRVGSAGVDVHTGFVRSLREAVAEAPIVVNCTGIGARELVPDRSLSPVRGQLLVVENPGVERFFAEHDESRTPTYFLPHGDHVVLGGSAEPGRTDLAPDATVAAGIRRRCAAVEPALADAKELAHRVGLRPARSRVRLEPVAVGAGHVIHNYGHGGAGVTLSWGCAREVLDVVRQVLASTATRSR